MEQGDKKKLIYKKPWVAGFLSLLLPGLGHFYSGKIKKAIGLYAAIWICLLLVWFFSLLNTFAGLILIICLGLTFNLVIFASAISTAKRNRVIEQKKYDKWYVYLLIILAAGVLYEFILQPARNKFSKVQFASCPTPAMSPTLTTGDKFTWQKIQAIQKSNIALFAFPEDPTALFIYRCVAAPGEKLEIRKGQVYVNGKLSDNSQQLKSRYLIRTDGALNQSRMQNLGIEEIVQIPGQGYMSNLTTEQVGELKKMEIVVEVIPSFMPEGSPKEGLFPPDPTLKWNTDFYGPLLVPKKGQAIEINEENIKIYGPIIKMCENESQVELNEPGLLKVDGQTVSSYTFRHDYYFMMGDNRHNAADSRYRGLVPDYLIKGKALYIYWSDDKRKIGKKL